MCRVWHSRQPYYYIIIIYYIGTTAECPVTRRTGDEKKKTNRIGDIVIIVYPAAAPGIYGI